MKTGTGENLLKLPEDGPPSSAIIPGSDLQEAGINSVPVENGFGTQVDTKQNYWNNSEWQVITRLGQTGRTSETAPQILCPGVNTTKRENKKEYLNGYVPIQISNLSLEEIELQKRT